MPEAQQNTRKEEILRVATRLFRARGFHGTRMDDVADVAKLNKATVYYYYRSKADILFAIYLKATDDILDAVAVVEDEDRSPEEVLRLIAERQLLLMTRDADQVAVYFQESPYLSEWLSAEQVAEIHERERRFERSVRAVMSRGLEQGRFVGEDAAVMTAAFLGMTGWFYRWYDPRRIPDSAKVAATFVGIFLDGVLAPGARA